MNRSVARRTALRMGQRSRPRGTPCGLRWRGGEYTGCRIDHTGSVPRRLRCCGSKGVKRVTLSPDAMRANGSLTASPGFHGPGCWSPAGVGLAADGVCRCGESTSRQAVLVASGP